MDLFEMFDNDKDGDRRQRRATSDEPPRKGIRGLFQRLVSTVSGEDDDDEPRRRNDGYDGSRNDGYGNDGYRNERRNRDRGGDWDD